MRNGAQGAGLETGLPQCWLLGNYLVSEPLWFQSVTGASQAPQSKIK